MSDHHRIYGLSKSAWADSIVNESLSDVVSFTSIVNDGDSGFDLSGRELEAFIRMCVRKLLEIGAVPVKESAYPTEEWPRLFDFGENANDIGNNIIDRWKAVDDLNDMHYVWFSAVHTK
jgi:hypothetical protein